MADADDTSVNEEAEIPGESTAAATEETVEVDEGNEVAGEATVAAVPAEKDGLTWSPW